VPPLVLKEKVTINTRGWLGNTITWSFNPGIYKPVYEDGFGIYYRAETPVVLKAGTLADNSGVYVLNSRDPKIRWRVWEAQWPFTEWPMPILEFDAPFPFVSAEK
jgi:hypothetical protein